MKISTIFTPQLSPHKSEGISHAFLQASSVPQILWVDNLHPRLPAVNCHESQIIWQEAIQFTTGLGVVVWPIGLLETISFLLGHRRLGQVELKEIA